MAYLIDAALIFAVGLVAYFLYSLVNADIYLWLTQLSVVLRVALTVGVFAVMWIYWTLFEVLWQGQTLGKRLMKIRVVGADGSPVTVFQSAVRNLVRLIDFAPICYPVGLVCMLLDRRNRRLGDIAAGTLLIREERVDLSRYEQLQGTRGAHLSSAELESVTDLLTRFDSLAEDSQLRLGRLYAQRLGLAAVDAEQKSAAELKAWLQTHLQGAPRG